MSVAPGPPPLYDLPTPMKWPLSTRLKAMDSRIIRCRCCGAQTMKKPDRLCSHCRKHGTPSENQ